MKPENKNIAKYLRLFAALVLVLNIGTQSTAIACSGIASQESSSPMLAGNYDWYARGGIVFLSPRHQMKSSGVETKGVRPMEWTSKYASLTVSQFGRDFPMQGMNEMGLAGLVLMGEAEYPTSGLLGVMTENHWLQYQLDQFSTVAEVIDHVNDFAIQKLSAPLHWFLCDRTNACVVVEFLKGRAAVFSADELPIRSLTNTAYQKALDFYRAWQSEARDVPQGYPSTSRFVRLASWQSLETFEGLESALNNVMSPGFTAWHGVFKLDSGRFALKLAEAGASWEEFDFSRFSLECNTELPMFDLQSKQWSGYDHEKVEELFIRAARGTIGLGEESRKRILAKSESVRCHVAQ